MRKWPKYKRPWSREGSESRPGPHRRRPLSVRIKDWSGEGVNFFSPERGGDGVEIFFFSPSYLGRSSPSRRALQSASSPPRGSESPPSRRGRGSRRRRRWRRPRSSPRRGRGPRGRGKSCFFVVVVGEGEERGGRGLRERKKEKKREREKRRHRRRKKSTHRR